MAVIWWVLTVLAPLGTAVAFLALSLGPEPHNEGARRLGRVAPLSLLPAAALAVLGPAAVGTVDAPWLLLGVTTTLDPVARPLLLMSVVLYAAALTAAAESGVRRTAVLSALLLVCFVGSTAVFVAGDVATFYVGYSVMSVAAYGLVVHGRDRSALRAGRAYLVLTMVSEMAVLVALLLVVDVGGPLLADAPAAVAASPHRSAIIGLLLLGFGIKAGTFPLHGWLPLAHPAAPPPGSAVLSGAMIKVGLVGWLRFLPLGEVAVPGWGTALVVLALVGAFGALVPGVLTDDPKVSLAYSSVSQMGFLGVLVGVALTAPELAAACVAATVVYAVHHGVAKGGLFLSITVWRLHGAGPLRPYVLGGMALLALAVVGAPLGSGAVAKYAAKQALYPAGFDVVDLAALLPLVGTVSTLLVVRAAVRLGHTALPGRAGLDAAMVSWTVLVLGGTVATWFLAGTWFPGLHVPALDAVSLWDALWPVLL
ncbi:MAG: proton-conducting transporter membrane subunit, partial [Propionicimonas sp.]|nr:proton-conducting transporter membrane subunit [Propionicimonas sp.]